jgi:hypothetical protein
VWRRYVASTYLMEAMLFLTISTTYLCFVDQIILFQNATLIRWFCYSPSKLYSVRNIGVLKFFLSKFSLTVVTIKNTSKSWTKRYSCSTLHFIYFRRYGPQKYSIMVLTPTSNMLGKYTSMQFKCIMVSQFIMTSLCRSECKMTDLWGSGLNNSSVSLCV